MPIRQEKIMSSEDVFTKNGIIGCDVDNLVLKLSENLKLRARQKQSAYGIRCVNRASPTSPVSYGSLHKIQDCGPKMCNKSKSKWCKYYKKSDDLTDTRRLLIELLREGSLIKAAVDRLKNKTDVDAIDFENRTFDIPSSSDSDCDM